MEYSYYVRSDGRIGVVLRRRDGKPMTALLDPARIKRVLLVAVPWKPPNERIMRSLVMVRGQSIYEDRFYGDEYVEKLKKMYPDAIIYPDHELVAYIVYESDHDYYEPAEVEGINGVVLKEGGLELLIDKSSRVKPCKGYGWRVYLPELRRWDEYCFDLATAFEIILTNIHPYYGVMD